MGDIVVKYSMSTTVNMLGYLVRSFEVYSTLTLAERNVWNVSLPKSRPKIANIIASDSQKHKSSQSSR